MQRKADAGLLVLREILATFPFIDKIQKTVL